MNSLLLFWQEVLRKPKSIGAAGPSSKAVARAMTAPLSAARRSGPVRVLEVGPGTGALTKEILPLLGPECELDLCEINPRFAQWLREHFEQPQDGGPRVRVLEGDATQLQTGLYDFIVSSVPISLLPTDLVEALLKGLLARLTARGCLSWLQYRGLKLRSRIARGPDQRRLKQIVEITAQYQERHGIGRELVWLNFPPAEVYYLARDPQPGRPLAQRAG